MGLRSWAERWRDRIAARSAVVGLDALRPIIEKSAQAERELHAEARGEFAERRRIVAYLRRFGTTECPTLRNTHLLADEIEREAHYRPAVEPECHCGAGHIAPYLHARNCPSFRERREVAAQNTVDPAWRCHCASNCWRSMASDSCGHCFCRRADAEETRGGER